MIKQLIRNRIAQATPSELVKYSRQYNIPLTENQANELLKFIQSQKIDPFSQKDRSRTFNYIDQNIGRKEARHAEKLMESLAKDFHLDHLF